MSNWQAEFADALLARDPAARPGWVAPADAARFAVYRNNLFHGLTEALGEAYPVVHRLVGDDFFRAAARAYIPDHPPRARSLALYGDLFPAFLAAFAPAQAVPYLADVARLERAWLESLHAADAASLDPAALARLGDGLVQARFAAHPAARVVASDHPVVSIWRANQDVAAEQDIVIDGRPETALLTRPGDAVRVRLLDPAQGGFATALLAGASAAEAARADVDVTETFRHLLADGAFAGLAAA